MSEEKQKKTFWDYVKNPKVLMGVGIGLAAIGEQWDVPDATKVGAVVTALGVYMTNAVSSTVGAGIDKVRAQYQKRKESNLNKEE